MARREVLPFEGQGFIYTCSCEAAHGQDCARCRFEQLHELVHLLRIENLCLAAPRRFRHRFFICMILPLLRISGKLTLSPGTDLEYRRVGPLSISSNA